MKRQEVKVYLQEDGQLILKKPDGTEVSVGIFNGGGYVTQLIYEPATPNTDNRKDGV